MTDPTTIPVRFTSLKQIALSPAHYLCKATEPDDSDNLSRRLGRGTHAMVFGTPEVVVYPGKVRNGKVWDEFKLVHADKEILNATEYDKSRRMADALLRHDIAASFLTGPNATVESVVNWSHLGRACRSRPDSYRYDALCDLKTTRQMPPYKFIRAAESMSYHAQISFYDAALRFARLAAPETHLIVTVENTPPYVVNVYELTKRALEYGRRQWFGWFETLLNCERSNEWPGYAQEPIPFDVDPGIDEMFEDDGDPEDPDWVEANEAEGDAA